MITVEFLRHWIAAFGTLVDSHHDQLNALDAAIGDADHGTNLRRGFTVVSATLDSAPDAPGGLLSWVGKTAVSNVGGAAGPLFGSFFLCLGDALGNHHDLDARRFALGLRAGLAGVVARGSAVAGDKTMYDTLAPGIDALDAAAAAQYDHTDIFQAGLRGAESGRDATIDLLARKGRASYLGERSVGHQDPGATSATLLFSALLE
ncbi:dihydroxyacetone kinase subunit L [Kribbella qitaiheensis]|uniref:Dihydroxyacetone kinase subunit L n=1 Tax=Kribbella qitaiheensis TaxID=1544730 RepID=A0A7G6WS83_9ACTN|nr:dihydroxyacetone kinase subunit DhaL [Kribbella qitaiheensis]QNE16848.1 dihydroxyacetone kinase subunit L [Kribbella qitaiheensis]